MLYNFSKEIVVNHNHKGGNVMPIPTNHSRPIRKTAKESAFIQLQQWIIDGTLQPGEKLYDTELASALGVSRTPIRESLQLLEVQGFVVMHPGKATQVTTVNKEDIKELLPPLSVLQALAAELATQHMDDQTIEQLEELNKKFAKLIDKKDFFQALKVDEEFHQVIVEKAGNRYIVPIIEKLQAHVRRLFFFNSIKLSSRSIEEHEAILSAFKKGDAEKASLTMKSNWNRTIDDFLK